MPLISVVVPVYKVEKYLERCVESILSQTYKDFELILVDDGSPDSSPKICDKYAENNPKIHVVHRENGGLSAARNSGIEWALTNSVSEWITFIDSDDWIHPKYLETLLNACVNNNTQISMGEVLVTPDYFISDEADPNDRIVIKKMNTAYQDDKLDPNSACCRLYKKNLFENIRFPVGKLHEDRFTTYKLYFQFEDVAVVEFPIYYYFVNNEGIVHSSWNVGRLDNLEAAENQIKFFYDTKNDEMYEYILRDYIHLMLVNLRNIKGKKEFRQYENLIRTKLKSTLKEHEKRLGMSLKKDFNTYKYAYPLKAKIYRHIFMK